MSDRIVMAKPEHEVAYQELVALVQRHADKLSALEILALVGNLAGKVIAMQDQRAISPDLAMETLIKNLEYGNAQTIAVLESPTKGNA